MHLFCHRKNNRRQRSYLEKRLTEKAKHTRGKQISKGGIIFFIDTHEEKIRQIFLKGKTFFQGEENLGQGYLGERGLLTRRQEADRGRQIFERASIFQPQNFSRERRDYFSIGEET